MLLIRFGHTEAIGDLGKRNVCGRTGSQDALIKFKRKQRTGGREKGKKKKKRIIPLAISTNTLHNTVRIFNT